MLMCPHCGWQYDPAEEEKRRKTFNHSLVPTHDYPKMCRSVCRGAGQIPRNPESDRRPLWKDQPPAENAT